MASKQKGALSYAGSLGNERRLLKWRARRRRPRTRFSQGPTVRTVDIEGPK